VAERRPQKYFGSSKGCPMSADPTSFPSRRIRLPLACAGKTTWAMPVTRRGYARPVRRVNSTRMMIAGLSWSMCVGSSV
jgi:hypothetical protein